MKKIILTPILIIAAAVAASVFALEFKQIESQGVKKTTECLFSVAPSTCAVTPPYAQAYGTSYSVYSTTGSVDFQVKFSSYSGGDPNVNASSTIHVLAGQSVGDRFDGMVPNPMIVITRIDAPGTTAYIDIGYLAPRAPGGF